MGRGGRRAVGGFVLAAVALAVVVLLVVAWPRNEPDQRPGTATYRGDGIAFEYPASWIVTAAAGIRGGSWIFAGTKPVPPMCVEDPASGTTSCQLRLPPLGSGDVVAVFRPATGGPPPACDFLACPPEDARPTTVGGLPAFEASPRVADGILQLTWTIAVPLAPLQHGEITAHVGTPDVGASAIARAIVASFRFDPPVQRLDRSPVGLERAIAGAVAQLESARSSEPEYECFPAVPSVTGSATFTREPNGPVLRRPLDVTCSWTLAPSVLEVWTVTRTFEWVATETQPAGHRIEVLWIAPDGTDLGGGLSSGDEFPGQG